MTTITGMGLLDGKNIVITGVLTDASLAFGVAKLAQEEGAEHRADRRRSGVEPDRARRSQASATGRRVRARRHRARAPRQRARRARRRSGDVSTACCTRSASRPRRVSATTSWRRRGSDVSIALHISAYSFKALADAFAPLMTNGGSFVGLDFDNSVAWPAYNWMGVVQVGAGEHQPLPRRRARADEESDRTSSPPGRSRRWLPRAFPGFKKFEDVWDDRAPLGWDVTDSSAVAKACIVLLSDWFPATTGEIIHVDGGYHATGA